MSESKISCPHCAQHIALDDAWAGQTVNCPVCQQPFVVPGTPPAGVPIPPAPSPSAPGLRISGPSAPPPPLSAPPRPTPAATSAARRAPAGGSRTSGLAVTSLVLSLLGCFGITAIAGIICGHIARRRIRNDPSLTGGGLALAGLIIGYLGLLLCVVSLVMFVIRARELGKEFSAEFEREMAKQAQNQPGQTGEPPIESGMLGMTEKIELPVPEGAVAGNINGQPFTYTKSTLNKAMSMLEVSEGEDFFADREAKIFLFLKPGESVENRTWKINATGTGMNPHVHLSWKAGDQNGVPKTQIVTSGYQLELKTAAITNNTITGSISLKVTGKTPAELKGNFTATVK